jgi:uncharacterized membrane protein
MPSDLASQRLLIPVKAPEAGRLVVLGFADESSAFALRDLLGTLEEEGVIEIGDAVIATRNARGKVRLHQSIPLVAFGTAVGSFGGMLLGMLLLTPLFGSVAGAATGALSAKLADVGIDDSFMKSLGETLTPGKSALFVLVRKTKPEVLIERLKPFAGRCHVLQTSLPAENEALLRRVLAGGLNALAPDPHRSTEQVSTAKS